MRVVTGSAERAPAVSVAVVVGALLMLVLGVLTAIPSLELGAMFLIFVGIIAYKPLLHWPTLLGVMLLTILLIPIKRYSLPGDLPFQLEPYRLLVAIVAGGWLVSLLVDPRVRLRGSGLGPPLFLMLFAALGSVVVNDARITSLGVETKVVKELTFLVSFVIVLYLVVSVTKTWAAVDTLVKVGVAGAAFVAFLAIIESRTGFNPFNRLGQLPFLNPMGEIDLQRRSGRFRAYASAQHPIALGAALVILIPPAVYLAHGLRQRRWWFAAALLALGALATLSRTSVLMLLVVALVFLWLRPKETKRLWPMLVPAVVVIHFALPGTIGSLRASFFPEGGLIADQSRSPGSRGQGRVADIAPTLDQLSESPILGLGYGTRVVDGETPNAQILDNQWLASLLETGIIGTFALLWLFCRAIRRLARAARADRAPPQSWLYASLAASITAYAVGMLTYDAFSFIQATFLAYILLALAGRSLQLEGSPMPASARIQPAGLRIVAPVTGNAQSTHG
jgi:hypothetical protein